MRIKLPLGRTLFFLSIFVLTLIALLPMRLGLQWLALDDRRVAARSADGSVWNGVLREAQLGGASVGDVDAGLGFFPLLIGNARLSVERDIESVEIFGEFDGAITVSGGDFGIDDLTARMPVADRFAPLPVASLDVQQLSAHFDSGICAHAEGTVRADFAARPAGLVLPAGATGAAQCDEGALLLPLIGQSGMDRFNIRIYADGRYRAELILRPADDTMRDRLANAGFVPGAGGYVMIAQGSF